MRGNVPLWRGWKRCLGVLLVCAAAATTSAQSFLTLHEFDGTEAAGFEGSKSPLVEGFDGKLYGTSVDDGFYAGFGTFFKIGFYGEFTLLQTNQYQGAPGSLALSQYGDFVGSSPTGGANGEGAVFRITPEGALTTLYNFCEENQCPGGSGPFSVIPAADGSMYGAAHASGGHDRGTVFKITSAGKLTIVYRFCALAGCADGSLPTALIQGTDGNFYGTTLLGGANFFWGSVFKLTPGGVLTTLYSFCSPASCDDGFPYLLIQSADGDFYGASFKLTPGGVLTVVPGLGADASGSLVAGTDGNIYGTGCGGGIGNNGTIFRYTPGGTVTTLHEFTGRGKYHDGSCPQGLMQATNGKFYGTTALGATNNDGTIFRLDVGLGPFVKTVLTSGSVGSRVTIIGQDLADATAVSFNGTAAIFTACSGGTEIVTTVPAGATSGPVTVTTPTGTLASNIPFRVVP